MGIRAIPPSWLRIGLLCRLLPEPDPSGSLSVKTRCNEFVTFLWRFFSSLKLTIFLLIGLAVVSIIGTVIPQGTPSPEYLQTISETKFHLYARLGFFDLYHSWWFILILYFLSLNLVACSLRRWPHDWALVRTPVTTLDVQQEHVFANVHGWPDSRASDLLERSVVDALAREFASPVVTKTDNEYHLFAQKGRFSRFGVYILHASIIIIFLGGLIGSIFGFRGFVEIAEGEASSVVTTNRGGAVDLGFTVRCDSFSLSYYNNGTPKEYRSVLSILENGSSVVEKRPVIVNDPLTYRGITFYQSGYSQAAPARYRFTVRDRASGAATRVTVTGDESVALPGGGTLLVTGYAPEIGGMYPGLNGPAVQVMVMEGNVALEPFVVMKRYPDINADRGGAHVLTFEGVDQKWRTGLQVTRDPGVPVVWAGCFFLITGIFSAFFSSHRRIWVRIGGGRVVVAGSASKNQAAFDAFFEEMVEKLKKV